MKSLLAICLTFAAAMAASLNDLSGILSVPLQWTTRTINYKTSSNCVANVGQSTWVLGGKASGVNNDISNTVRKEQFSQNGFITLSNDQTLLVPGSFPGQYVNSPGMFCSLGAQVAFGTYNNVPKMCYLGGNDGTSNSPQCGCCSVEVSGSTVKCEDLDTLQICPPVFASCVVNDNLKNRAIQIGGSTGTSASNNLMCFDISTEKYTYGSVNTINLMQNEAYSFDPQCEYGNLATAAYDVGCDFLPNDQSRSIIVVGGRNFEDSSTFLDTIQVCKGNYQNCQIQSLRLPQPTSQLRVLGLTSCIFIAFGGLTDSGTLGETYIGDICNQQWLHTQKLPAMVSEFSVVIGTNVLCLYGGIVSNKLQNTAYCTNYNPPAVPTTPRPTRRPTKRPTPRPTSKPTLRPTSRPTIAEQGTPQFYQGWNSAYQWSDGHDSQTCYATRDYLYVLGGKNSAQQSLNTITAFDAYNKKYDYVLYQYNPLVSSQTMTPFHCPNSCSGGYQNRFYLVNPYTDDGSVAARLFECTITTNTNSAMCKDLCDPNFGILPYCASVLFWDSCVTAQDQYLYIIGGRDSVSRRSTITVFDMVTRDWVSVPNGSPAASKYPSFYGSITTPVTNHACATWNSDIYIFGGQVNGNQATNIIQRCVKNGACNIQNAHLNIARYYSSATTIGSTIVILCGAHDSETVTDVVELYDVPSDKISVDYDGKSRGMVLPSARRSCCVSRWDATSSLMMSGGVNVQGSYSTSVESISAAAYGIQENLGNGKALSECKSIALRTSNPSFLGVFFFYTDLKQYRIWISSAYDSVIYYQPNNYDHTWVGNLSSFNWAYYPPIGFSTGYWTVLGSRYNPQQSTYFEFTCLDSEMYTKESSSSDYILGVSSKVFVAILVAVVVAALIFIAVTIYCCKRRYKNRNKEITIQSSSYGVMKKMLSKSSVASASELKRISSATTPKEDSGNDANKPESETAHADSFENNEPRPSLTENEIQAVERGGVHVQGYRSSNVNTEEEELSSVDSQNIQFAEHKMFKNAEETKLHEDEQVCLVNPVTGEMIHETNK